MACHHTDVVDRLEYELEAINQAIEGCHWAFAQLSVLEHRRAVVMWVLDMLRGEVAA